MKILITGGAGFIGSHLVDHYLRTGNEVTVLDNLATGSSANLIDNLDNIQLINGDIRDAKLVSKLVNKSEIVLHMAAALGVNNILNSTIESVSTNFFGSEVVLNAALKYDKRILIASTSEIYGKNPKQPLSELDDRVVGAPQKIRWTYSDAKALEEAIAHSLYLESGLRVTTIRFFNTVGPRQTGKYGMVVPRFVKSALDGNPIEIYGTGEQSRVFCHVLDAVDAISQILLKDESIGEVFNVGGTGEITINKLAETVVNLTKSKSKIIHKAYEEAYSPGFEDMQRRVPDITKVKKFINWEPTRNLEGIITDIQEYMLKAKAD